MKGIVSFLKDHNITLDGEDCPHVPFDTLLSDARLRGLDVGKVCRAGSLHQMGSTFELNHRGKYVVRVIVRDDNGLCPPLNNPHVRIYATKANTRKLERASAEGGC